MSTEQDPCLAARDILAYLDGELPESRKAEVDRHLDECRFCEAAVQGVAGLEWREGFVRSTEALLARVRSRTAMAVMAAAARRPAPRFRAAPQYLALAATLVVGVAAAVYLTRPGPGEVVFQRHFEPYPGPRPVVRGGLADDGRSNGLAAYEARDYRGAVAALEESLEREPNDPVVLFYAGLSRLALGQTREAIGDLERVRRLGKNELQAPAEWYLALAHLRRHAPPEAESYLAFAHLGRHDLADARSRLERIAATEGFYQEKARALLSELDRLDSGK